jgi:hypothetical protein
MLTTKKITNEEKPACSQRISEIKKYLTSSKGHLVLRAVFDLDFFSDTEKAALAASPDFKIKVRKGLICLNKIGDMLSINKLLRIIPFSSAELKNTALLASARKGVQTLSAYGYFSDAFDLLELYQLPTDILKKPHFQESAFLGLAALKCNRVKNNMDIQTIIKKYNLPQITETEWLAYTKKYFLMELSDPLIYKSYTDKDDTLKNWQEFINYSLSKAAITDKEIEQAATAGIKKIYDAGEKKRAGRLILYFSLQDLAELAYIVNDIEVNIFNNILNFNSAQGIGIKIIKRTRIKPLLFFNK